MRYRCPCCGAELRSPLAEAGSRDSCPVCGGGFVVPACTERVRRERAAAAAARDRVLNPGTVKEQVIIGAAVLIAIGLFGGAVAVLTGAWDSADTVTSQIAERQQRDNQRENERRQRVAESEMAKREAALAAEQARWTKAKEDAEQRLRTEIEYQRLLRDHGR